ncbi:MAG: hypothetical protein ACXW31_17950 [Thermoanaerobaculia bacterium]
MLRQTPRVILRTPRRGRFDEDEVLVLEMGLGGAKFEHATRLDVSRKATFTCGPLTTEAVVKHSVLLPAKTGVVYQSGVSFVDIGKPVHDLLLDLLVHEAQEQVIEWESNLEGVERRVPARRAARQSAVALRFLVLRRNARGWEQRITSDPNQPGDGITIIDGTAEEDIAVLKETYDNADEAMRELMRRVATVAILEQLRS